MGADDALPQCLWLRCCIEGHVYAVEDLKLQQDNISSVLMENNGKCSSMNQKNHVKLQYLFIKYFVENRDLSRK